MILKVSSYLLCFLLILDSIVTCQRTIPARRLEAHYVCRPETFCDHQNGRANMFKFIPRDNVCDGFEQCPCGDDELKCNPNICEAACPGQFQCVGENKCIPTFKVCDTIEDCSGGHDEINCTEACSAGQFMCTGSQTCIEASNKCDCPELQGDPQCNCKNADFRCFDLNGILLDFTLLGNLMVPHELTEDEQTCKMACLAVGCGMYLISRENASPSIKYQCLLLAETPSELITELGIPPERIFEVDINNCAECDCNAQVYLLKEGCQT